MPERFEGQRPEEEQPIGAEKLQEESRFSPEQILDLSPKEMADLFTKLDEEGKLESFLNESAENNALVAQFSYWEKWLEKDQRRLVDQVVAEKSKIYEGREDAESLPLHLEKKFTPEELKLIFSATGAIQLGFYQLQKSVWAIPYPCEKEIQFLCELFSINRFVNIITADKIYNDIILRKYFDLL